MKLLEGSLTAVSHRLGWATPGTPAPPFIALLSPLPAPRRHTMVHYTDADTFNHPGQIISRKMLQRWENSTFKTQQPNRIEDGQNISFLFSFEALWRQCMNMKIKLYVGSPNDENDDTMAWQEEVSQL